MVDERVRAALQQGYFACQAGKRLDQNPFKKYMQASEWSAWNEGWQTAYAVFADAAEQAQGVSGAGGA